MTSASRGADRVFPAGLAVILGVALAIRLPLLDAGPGYLNRDELMYVAKAVRYGGGDLNPHYFQNPPLQSYLVFGALLVWYAFGRVTGWFAGPLDFKAQYVADAAPAYFVARLLVLAVALAAIVHVAYLARRLAGDAAGILGRRMAGWAAASAMTFSWLHALKSAAATNEMLVTALFTVAVHAALVLAERPTLRNAVVAGAVAGVCGGAKYTGALAALAVTAACVLAPGLIAARRVRLLVVAGLACIAAFLVVCPWPLLDAGTFHAHLLDLFASRDRFQDGRGWLRYLEMAWGGGLGPVWSILGVAGLVVAAVRVVRSPVGRAARVVVLVAVLGMTLYLLPRDQMALGRYLLPVYPCVVALAAAELAVTSRRARALLAGAAALAAGIALAAMPSRIEEAMRPDPRDEMAAWIRAHLPDGARVVADVHAPWLPDWETRREFEGRVPAATLARLTPAFRLSTPYHHFRGPMLEVGETGVRADDFDGLARLGGVHVLVTELARHAVTTLPPGEYPGAAWHAEVRRRLELVHAVPAEVGGEPAVSLYRVPAPR